MSCCKDNRPRPVVKPKLGGWSISIEVYNFIKTNLNKGSTILELGSGWGTEVLSKDYIMYSVEHNERFLGKYTSNYIHAPMKGHWYDKSVLESKLEVLKPVYSLILIDGPVGNESNGRIGFYENLQMFNSDVLMVFTNTNRDGERDTFTKVLNSLEPSRQYKIFKTYSIIYPKYYENYLKSGKKDEEII